MGFLLTIILPFTFPFCRLEAGKQIISLAGCHLQFIKKLRSVGLFAEYVCKAQGERACCAGDA